MGKDELKRENEALLKIIKGLSADSELLKDIKELVKEGADSWSIPANIHLDCDKDILFNDDKQILFEDKGLSSVYVVYGGSPVNRSEDFKLVRCNREDLKVGDTAYKTAPKNPYISGLYDYCKILKDGRYAYIYNDKNAMVGDTIWEYWFKVVDK